MRILASCGPLRGCRNCGSSRPCDPLRGYRNYVETSDF